MIPRTYDLLLPKFHFILPKFHLSAPWGIFVCSLEILDFLGRGWLSALVALVLLVTLVKLGTLISNF